MKLEIEVSEELLTNHLNQYIKQNLTGGNLSYAMRQLLDKQARISIISAFESTDFSNIIKDKCEEVAIKEIEKSAAKKVPGWVQRQMKEMLKYSRARFWEDKKED